MTLRWMVLTIALLLPGILWAVPPAVTNPTINTLQCRLTVIFSDLPNGYESKAFTVPLVGSANHGGEPLDFNFSSGHKVSVLADGKWLGIDWSHGDEHMAEVVTVIRNPTKDPRALIVYWPKNSDYHADLDCLLP